MASKPEPSATRRATVHPIFVSLRIISSTSTIVSKMLLEISLASVEDLQPEPTPRQLSTEPRLKLPVEAMAGLLTPNDLRIFRIVQDLGRAAAQDVILEFHDRHEPLEPANVVMILRRLVDRSILKATAGPAPSTAPFDEYLYFEVLDVPITEHITSGSMDLEHAISLIEKALRWVRVERPDFGRGSNGRTDD